MARHLLITGLPGTGKTTLLVRLARLIADLSPSGFYTEEIREGRERRGFRMAGFDGSRGMLAHVDFRGHHRVGHYGVDVAGFEAFLGRLALETSPTSLIILDEIGKMECLSPRFKSLVRNLLESDKTLVASVAMTGEGFIAQMKKRPDCQIVEITPANREKLAGDLVGWIREHAPAETGR